MRSIAFILIACVSLLGGCGGNASDSSESSEGASSGERVTLYTSVDAVYARMVIEEFERKSGIRVDLVSDSETGSLASRLRSERGDPVCDVWWSSEPLETVWLAHDGVLMPRGMEGTVTPDWPGPLRGSDWSWVGTAMSSRVIVYAPDRVDFVPTTMAELTEPIYKGRVGMARPQFGTTRIHMATLASGWGIEAFEQWLVALEANGVRLYDGNTTVVRAVETGEIDIGLTDADAVWVGQASGWDVDLVTETHVEHPLWPSNGETTIPSTVGVVRNAPNRKHAMRLSAYLVSPAVEQMLHETTARSMPANPGLRLVLGLVQIDEGALANPAHVSEMVEMAMDACARVLGP